MKSNTVWNVLRVLAIVGLGSLLFLVNILGTLPSRHLLADLRKGEVEVATETARKRFSSIENTEYQVLRLNLYAIPALVIIALLPYVRRKKSGPLMTQRDGCEQSPRTLSET